jgi:hypothetical protein
MPVPPNVVRANIRATVGTNEEIVHTLHLVRVNTASGPDLTLEQIADNIVTAWTAFLNDAVSGGTVPKSLMRSDLVYRTVDTYELNAAGLATDQAQRVFGATAAGTNTGFPLPPEVALVASLKTGLPGRSKRGRLYTGGFSSPALASGGLVLLSVQTAIANGLRVFGTALKMQDSTAIDQMNWVVLSRALTQVNKITEIRVGNVWDVQRRRQNGIAETFVSQEITY